jgi:LCP family protein required for cell wall assembly
MPGRSAREGRPATLTSVISDGPSSHGRLTRWLVGISATVSIAIAAGSAYGFVAYKQADNVGVIAGDALSTPAGSDDPCSEGVCNYLLLGSDSRAGLSAQEQEQFGTDMAIGGENRADTIMLVHTDPNLEKAIILSFPRDLWVQIPGHGSDKINASFEGGVEGGGPDLVARTVRSLTGLRVDHVLYVDLAGFQGVVDTLGGVDMCIPAENVNTPGYVDAEGQSVYYNEPGYIADPLTGLHVKPGCQRLPGDQALAYVRTRHLRCDAAAPDFFRIARQQQFLRAVINELLQPDQLAQLPLEIKPIMQNLRRDAGLKIADLAYLVGQLQGISTGAAEFRTVPGTAATIDGLSVIRLDPAARRIFKAVRDGEQLGPIGTEVYTLSEANVPVRVVDRASGGGATGVEQVLSQAGFDISPGMSAATMYAKKVPGNVIAYAPGSQDEAAIVAKYFPNLPQKQVVGLPDHVAVFVGADYEPAPVTGAGGADSTCPTPGT